MPMLVLSSTNATGDLGMGRGRLHEITSQQAVTAPLTAFSKTALKAGDVPDLVAQAFAVFSAARPRPVHISLPLDVLDEPADFAAAARRAAPPPMAPPAAIAAAADCIRTARRPVIISGGGAVESGGEVAALAGRIGAAVILTIASKGVVPDDHPRCLGATLSLEPTQTLLSSADVVIAVGTELSETDSWTDRLPITGRLVRIDIDPASTMRDYPPEVAVVGDAGAALAAINGALADHTSDGIPDSEIAALKDKLAIPPAALQTRHAKVLDALREALPDDGVIMTDSTQIAYFGHSYFPCSRPRCWFFPSGYGTLGWALPAAIGARLAAPDRATVALAGDGGFLFTVQELGTAVELGLPIAIVLWNNDGLGEIRDNMIERGIPEIGVNPRNPDYVALAQAFGARATRPDSLDAFKAALTGAFAADGPTLIEMREDAPFLD